jgi:REP element-mobilizing transposase RayT
VATKMAYTIGAVSHVRRLRLSDRIFFVTVNLRRARDPLEAEECRHVAAALEESRRRLGFLLCGYVLMPDHWHAVVWMAHPLTLSRVIQSIKWISARSLNDARGVWGSGLATPILGPLCASREGTRCADGLHAPEPGAEGIGQQAGGMALVELQ